MPFKPSVRELAFKLSHGFCRCSPMCQLRADEIHHKLSNTKVNRKKFPLFLNSIFNACPVSHQCHMSGLVPKITIQEAEVFEEYFREITRSAQ